MNALQIIENIRLDMKELSDRLHTQTKSPISQSWQETVEHIRSTLTSSTQLHHNLFHKAVQNTALEHDSKSKAVQRAMALVEMQLNSPKSLAMNKILQDIAKSHKEQLAHWNTTLEILAKSSNPFVKLHNAPSILRGPTDCPIAPAMQVRPFLGKLHKREGKFVPEPINSLTESRASCERGQESSQMSFRSESVEQVLFFVGIKGAFQSLYVKDIDTLDGRKAVEMRVRGRNRRAYEIFYGLETHIRRFINIEMTKAFGTHWIKQRVSGELYDKWCCRRDQDFDHRQNGFNLIEYCDFSDYVEIIVRNDNWDRVFSSVFRRKYGVQESFYRLFPIRNCIMHSRILTGLDLLHLIAETTRLLNAMRIEDG